MIYFIYGEDSYRSKRKLDEIVLSYKEKHKSGLNLIYIDVGPKDFKDFYGNLQINSMFAEKKLVIIRGAFLNIKFQEDFLESISELEETKDIIVVYESGAPDQRIKFFKSLKKIAKCQEFTKLNPVNLKKWAIVEFNNQKAKIKPGAVDVLISSVGNDLWRMSNEINKLSNYKHGGIIDVEDVKLLVKPGIESDIFKTIEALASKNKRTALSLLQKHIDGGDDPLYLLSMIAYQFKTLLIIKQLQEEKLPYSIIAKKSGLHPFVVQKNNYLSHQFSMLELKKIYQEIFQADLDIKTGKIGSDTAMDLLLSKI